MERPNYCRWLRMKRDAKLRERSNPLKHLESERWISAEKRFDTMGFAAFKIFDAFDAGVDELPDCYHADGFDLLHLQRTVIPSPRSQAPLEHQSTVNADRVT
jgi:hypothetical protein